jgi:adenine-specific DNA-methyltransferase
MTIDLRLGDCLEILPTLPDNSVDLILTDPPYYKVKGDAWDRQWDTPQGFLNWLDKVLEQYARILKANGSLYVFASPQMSARVEVLISGRFNVLNDIRWVKEAGWHNKTEKEALRSFLSPYESIIFAEKYGADGITPLGDAIKQARLTAGLKGTDIDIALGYVRTKDPQRGTELCRRWEEGSSIPSEQDFVRAFQVCGMAGDYGELRNRYEDLRRPFSVSADVPYTDVWTFKTVQTYAGKHPCEKPLDMLEHIIKASSREGAVVLDSFMGTGNTGIAAQRNGRDFIGIEKDAKYYARAEQRIGQSQMVMAL